MMDSGPMTFLTVDSTEEFKVQTNGMSAEFGRTSGGVISMITKSGTNDITAACSSFCATTKLNANDFFANKAGRAIAPDKVNQFGGTVGGPIKQGQAVLLLQLRRLSRAQREHRNDHFAHRGAAYGRFLGPDHQRRAS